MQNEHDFTFVRKFGKLAFKYSLASQHSTTKHIDFYPVIYDLFYLERACVSVIEYARVVFSNRSRVLDYLEVNFCKFSFTEIKMNEHCEIFVTDINQVLKQYLGVDFITQFLYFYTIKKIYLESIFDGCATKPAQDTIFISIYFDDF